MSGARSTKTLDMRATSAAPRARSTARCRARARAAAEAGVAPPRAKSDLHDFGSSDTAGGCARVWAGARGSRPWAWRTALVASRGTTKATLPRGLTKLPVESAKRLRWAAPRAFARRAAAALHAIAHKCE